MPFDHSWKALLNPGESAHHFCFNNDCGGTCPCFDAETTRYSLVNAWWLSEMSRLVYVREADEIDGIDTGRSRNGILSTVDLQELRFIGKNGIQCAVISSGDTVGTSFAALVFRGTNALETWFSHLNTRQSGWSVGGAVHFGFKNEFYKIWNEVNDCLSEMPSKLPVFYAGHSLGGALATLAASRRPPAALYTFGSPRVGDAEFVHSLRGVPVFRVVNNRDPVTLLPPSRMPFDFHHVGELYHYPRGGGCETNPSVGNTAALSGVNWAIWAACRAYLDRRFAGPPEFLSDHAPINYSRRLEEEIRISLQMDMKEYQDPFGEQTDRFQNGF